VLPGENADQLPEVFLGLPSRITLQKQDVEQSFAFSASGVEFVLLVLGLSLWRSCTPRPLRM
jgi:hypothetical protein